MTLDEPKENEEAIDYSGINILVDASVKPYAVDQKIDYIDNWSGKGFVITGASSCC